MDGSLTVGGIQLLAVVLYQDELLHVLIYLHVMRLIMKQQTHGDACVSGCSDETDENSWSITDADGNELASGADADGAEGFGACLVDVPGCTDANALNYNADANVDDCQMLLCYQVHGMVTMV